MIKILWFSNHEFSTIPESATGTWLGVMGRALVSCGVIELYNITISACTDITRRDAEGVKQWVLPNWSICNDGLPHSDNVLKIKALVDSIRPDVIHVWGLENYYGLMVARGVFSGYKTLLDMQGVRFAVGEFYMGNLTEKEQRQCIGVREWIRPSVSIMRRQKDFLASSKFEQEIIKGFLNISYQSEWVYSYLKMLAKNEARLFKTLIPLRPEFFADGVRWSCRERSKAACTIFSLCGGNDPFKGAYLLLKAAQVLRDCVEGFGQIRFEIGGSFGRRDLFRSGYLRFLERRVREFGLVPNFVFLGALTAIQIREHLLSASVFVNPSFVESYSLTTAEALSVGVPCVVSNAGAMPELAEADLSALYFPSGDYIHCAERIRRILQSQTVAIKLSESALRASRARVMSGEGAASRQVEIYRQVLQR